jgi:[ribosomal protein S5]-alanine N-acetyltransferase
MRIELSRSAIRSLQMTDAPNLVRHANNFNVWINLSDRFPHPYTLLYARTWLKRQVGSRPETVFAIEVDGNSAGQIGFDLRRGNRLSAEIGYWLGEAYWGRGIVTEALTAMTEYAFIKHRLLCLYAHVFEWNTASIRVLEKCGYVRVGTLPRSAIKNNKIINQMVYAFVP